ncbi:hypothetical protein PVAND_005655 [Polypedilum vanderplanki]|uniref:Uncharacterized protein n=1 Tax=Polypedilum vanderplanki TaxID=319348 RepID=A0A9J6C1P3_POLVA|nr:hypothetical protein PVAND_005655 [Polypedilum vanderplanki]
MSINKIEDSVELLEKLQSTETSESQNLIFNGKFNENEITTFLKEQNCCYSEKPLNWKYSCHLFYHIQQIISKIDIDSSNDINQKNCIFNAIQECWKNSLEIFVMKQNKTTYKTTDLNDNDAYEKLKSSIRMVKKFFSIKLVASNSLFDDIKIDYLVGVFAILAMKRNECDVKEFYEIFTQIEAQIGIELLFKFLMMIKIFAGLSKDFSLLVHRELIKMIRKQNGFILLCRNLLKKGDDNSCRKLEVITKIIEGATTHPAQRKAMILEIFKTLRMCLINDERDIIIACIFVLQSFKAKANEEISEVISNQIVGQLDILINPNTTLYGSILMESNEFISFIDILSVLFSTSNVTSLSSKILHMHTVVLFNLYSILPPETSEREKLARVMHFILNNLSKSELQSFIRNLRLKDDIKILKLNSRVCFKNNTFQIGEENAGLNDDTDAFLTLLKSSNNALLLFEIFICLLKILKEVQNSSDTFLTNYNLDEDELPEVLHKKFFKKLSIIEPLQEMIQWKLIQSQLNENPMAIIDAIKEILEKSINEDDENMIIFLSLFKELLGKIKNDEQRKHFTRDILKISDKIKKEHIKSQVTAILLNDNHDKAPDINPSKIAYDDAIRVLQSGEVYFKAYGCDILIKLLKKRDKQTIVNRHTILAAALQNMKETESHAYLNIIRLVTALSYVMDSEVIEALIAEFENNENDIDHRLKFGEVIVKVTEDLGELSFKFRKQLIQCFLKGTRNDNNEFRTSSLANLGTICKILSFQIHNFFHEMFQQLDVIIRCDEYLPSKRAATMVLSNILAGMPNLISFQEFLLSIYHLLKNILATENDEQTKLHAQIGLEHLNEKTKEFLNPQLNLQKEIKIHLDKNPHKIEEIKYK